MKVNSQPSCIASKWPGPDAQSVRLGRPLGIPFGSCLGQKDSPKVRQASASSAGPEGDYKLDFSELIFKVLLLCAMFQMLKPSWRWGEALRYHASNAVYDTELLRGPIQRFALDLLVRPCGSKSPGLDSQRSSSDWSDTQGFVKQRKLS